VVIFAPIIKNWARKVGLPHTKFLIPLSYATILGGICTLIGTSTNLVVDGLIQDTGREGMTMFEIGKIGIIICIVGMAALWFAGSFIMDVLISHGEFVFRPTQLIIPVVLGVVEAFVSGFISSTFRDAAAFAILIIVLLVRPTGIFGKNTKEKV
jgi:di/tricarboxylate transporter